MCVILIYIINIIMSRKNKDQVIVENLYAFLITVILATTGNLTPSLLILSFSIFNALHLRLIAVLAKRRVQYFLSECQVLFEKKSV